LQQTGANVEDTTAGNIGPEAGTTYTVEIRDPLDDSLIDSETGISGTSAVFDLSAVTAESLHFILWAERDTRESWQRHEWTATVASV
jgi:hypothetical protein